MVCIYFGASKNTMIRLLNLTPMTAHTLTNLGCTAWQAQYAHKLGAAINEIRK